MSKEQALCAWCREGDHEGCIGDSDPYGPPCECDHDEPQQAFRPPPERRVQEERIERALLHVEDMLNDDERRRLHADLIAMQRLRRQAEAHAAVVAW